MKKSLKITIYNSFGIATFFLLIAHFFLVGATYAAEGDFLWAHGFGQDLKDVGHKIFVDPAGNVYSTGYFRGTVDFDPGAGTFNLSSAAGNRDIFVSKLDNNGNFVWAKAIGGNSDDEGYCIFVDAAGNVYTTGYFQGTNVDFDPGVNTAYLTSNSGDIFISKLDSNGDFVDAWGMGGTSFDYGWGIFSDSFGNIYTTGYFQNTVDFDPGVGVANLTSASVNADDIFISKLNSDGSFGWAKAIGGTAADVGLGISHYADSYIYVTGYFQGANIDFDPGPGTSFLTSSGGSYDVFVSKFDSNGNFLWAKSIGSVSEDTGQAVVVDLLGNVYTTGYFQGTVDFDPNAGVENLSSNGPAADIFVSKLDSSGNFVWAKAIGGSVADVGYGISVDRSGNVYTTGFFQGTVDFDPGPGIQELISTTPTNTDIFISKLDSTGNFAWAKGMGGDLDDYGLDISVDPSGAVYTTGSFKVIADFDPGPGTHNLASSGSFNLEDIFICKLEGQKFPWAMFLPAIIGNKKY